MEPHAGDGDPCGSCGGEIEYHDEARSFICTACGIVAESGRDVHLVHADYCEAKTPFNVPGATPRKLSEKAYGKKVTAFKTAAVRAAELLGLTCTTLPQHFRQLGKEMLQCYSPIPRGKYLKMAGLASVLLFCRQNSKPVTLADVCRVGNVSEKELNAAYKRLTVLLQVTVPKDGPHMYILRFREAAVNLVVGDKDGVDTESRLEHWRHIFIATEQVIRVSECLWTAAGRRPMIFAGAAVAVAVRMYTTRRANTVPSALLCDVPSSKLCCESIAAAAFAPFRTIMSMYRTIGRPVVKALYRVLPAPSPAKMSTFHEYVLKLHDSLFEKGSGSNFQVKTSSKSEICSGILPEARIAIDSDRARRHKILKIIHGSISKPSAASNLRSIRTTHYAEVKAIEKLVQAGASDSEILTGYFESIQRKAADCTLPAESEDIDSDDSDVEDMLKTPQEVLASSLF